jgi:hypothetical protein
VNVCVAACTTGRQTSLPRATATPAWARPRRPRHPPRTAGDLPFGLITDQGAIQRRNRRPAFQSPVSRCGHQVLGPGPATIEIYEDALSSRPASSVAPIPRRPTVTLTNEPETGASPPPTNPAFLSRFPCTTWPGSKQVISAARSKLANQLNPDCWLVRVANMPQADPGGSVTLSAIALDISHQSREASSLTGEFDEGHHTQPNAQPRETAFPPLPTVGLSCVAPTPQLHTDISRRKFRQTTPLSRNAVRGESTSSMDGRARAEGAEGHPRLCVICCSGLFHALCASGALMYSVFP